MQSVHDSQLHSPVYNEAAQLIIIHLPRVPLPCIFSLASKACDVPLILSPSEKSRDTPGGRLGESEC
jgi:hypothetical protein